MLISCIDETKRATADWSLHRSRDEADEGEDMDHRASTAPVEILERVLTTVTYRFIMLPSRGEMTRSMSTT